MNVTWTWSVAWNGAAVSTVLVYASPGLTGLAARWRYGEPLSAVRGLAFAGSLLGCVLVARAHDPAAWRLNGAGIAAGLLSAGSFTFYSMMGRSAARRGIDPWAATLAVFAVAAVALLPVAALSLPPSGPAASLLSLGGHAQAWGLLVLLAVAPTIGGYGLYTVSLQYLPAATANLLATLEPALTAVWAWWLLGESLAPVQLLGGGLILSSVLLLRLEKG
jgi:drug/metabolite transporter (DMT)-like permease